MMAGLRGVMAGPQRTYSPWVVLAAVLLGNFSAGIVFTLLSVARATIGEDLGASPSLVLWAFTGPSLAAAVAGPALGRLGDLYGHRRLTLIGLSAGIVCAVLVGVAPNVSALIALRMLASLFGAMLGPSALALIFSVFGEGERVKALGYWSLVNAGSPVLGVLLGGPIVDRFGWRTMFFAQAPLFAIAFVVGVIVLPDAQRRAVSRFDVPGAVTIGAATLALLLAVNRGPVWGWGDPRVLAGIVLTPALIALFVWIERRAEHPLVPLSVLAVHDLRYGIAAQSFAQFAYLGAGLFLVNDLLVDPSRYALSLSDASRYTIARPIPFGLVAPIAGYLAVRSGERFTASLGMACLVVSMVTLALLPAGGSLVLLVVAVALCGLALGLASPPLTSSITRASPLSSLGAVTAAQMLVSQVGGVIGTQTMVTIVGGDGVRTADGYHLAFGVASVAALIAFALTTRLGSRQEPPAR